MHKYFKSALKTNNVEFLDEIIENKDNWKLKGEKFEFPRMIDLEYFLNTLRWKPTEVIIYLNENYSELYNFGIPEIMHKILKCGNFSLVNYFCEYFYPNSQQGNDFFDTVCKYCSYDIFIYFFEKYSEEIDIHYADLIYVENIFNINPHRSAILQYIFEKYCEDGLFAQYSTHFAKLACKNNMFDFFVFVMLPCYKNAIDIHEDNNFCFSQLLNNQTIVEEKWISHLRFFLENFHYSNNLPLIRYPEVEGIYSADFELFKLICETDFESLELTSGNQNLILFIVYQEHLRGFTYLYENFKESLNIQDIPELYINIFERSQSLTYYLCKNHIEDFLIHAVDLPVESFHTLRNLMFPYTIEVYATEWVIDLEKYYDFFGVEKPQHIETKKNQELDDNGKYLFISLNKEEMFPLIKTRRKHLIDKLRNNSRKDIQKSARK